MKKYFKLILCCVAIFSLQNVTAQTKALQLSDQYPEAGKKITVMYDAAATPLGQMKNISSVVFYYTYDAVKPIELVAKADGNKLTASFIVPAAAKALLFRFSKDTITDKNNGEGYIFPVYKNKIPVQGAIGSIAKIYNSQNNQGRLKMDQAKALYLYRQEFTAYPVSEKQFNENYTWALYNSKNEDDKKIFQNKLKTLTAGNEEKDLMVARQYYRILKQAPVADSLLAVIKKKFPSGEVMRDEKSDTIYTATEASKKEMLYKQWIKEFPPKAGGNNIQYDYARNSVAVAYAKENNIPKALQYVNLIETKPWQGNGYSGVAEALQKNGELKVAEGLLKRALANSNEFRTTRKNEEGAGFAASAYYGLNNSYAKNLFLQKKYTEALKYVEIAYENAKPVRGSINANYAKILMALGKDKEAFDKIDEAVKEGQATAEMKEDLKTLYTKVKGSDAGYSDYMVEVNKILAAKIKQQLARQMINLPAPQFTLKDVDGNSVSLASLKGKTVVVDFWATWCGPCKASFPAMRMAVNRYKDSNDVKFLFVHTWEREDSATVSAKKYVTENKYPFEVLMDLKDPATGENNVVSSFKVNGIPTKFVIDKSGNIRFRFTGFSGGEDAAVEEVAAMIELAKN